MSCMTEISWKDYKKEEKKVVLSNGICFKIFEVWKKIKKKSSEKTMMNKKGTNHDLLGLSWALFK